MADVFIKDEYVASVSELVTNEMDNIESTLKAYINLLQGIHDMGIMEGETAEALEAFIEEATMLKGNFEEIAKTVSITCDAFIDKVDEADQYLYGGN